MYNFSLGKEESDELDNWLREHNKTCRYSERGSQGAIGGRLTYNFCPNSLGLVVKVECACGEEVDLTDYNW